MTACMTADLNAMPKRSVFDLNILLHAIKYRLAQNVALIAHHRSNINPSGEPGEALAAVHQAPFISNFQC
jgi:hypothetical protein